MSFFTQFPRALYDLKLDGDLSQITDIFRNVDVNEKLIDGYVNYTLERVESGERPDQMSQRLYNSSDYYWTFFIANDFLKAGIDAWPKGQQHLEEFIKDTYSPYSVLTVSAETLREICGMTSPLTETITLGSDSGIKIHKIDETRQQIWLVGNYSILNNVEQEAFAITGYDPSPEVFAGNNLFALDGFANAENAPYSYNVFDSTSGDIIRTTDFTSYAKYHQNEDDERSLIKVIQPALIDNFVDEYKNLINE